MSPHEVLSAAAVDTNVVSAPGLVFPKLTFTDMLHVPAPAAPQFQPAEPQPLQHALNPATRYEIRGPEQEGAVAYIRPSASLLPLWRPYTSPVGWDYRRSGLTLLGRVTMMDRDIAKSTFLPTIPRLLH